MRKLHKKSDIRIKTLLLSVKNCSDPDVQEECGSMRAECKMNWREQGYYCKCRAGYFKDVKTEICKGKLSKFFE